MDTPETNIDRLLKARAEIDEQLRQHKTNTAVLFTDVVASTKYFDRYGDTAGFAMVERHAQLGAGTVREFDGRVVKTIGDSVMAEFSDPVACVRAAVELQRKLYRMNEKLPQRDRLQLRIGINYGSCFLQEGDLFGDAVNLAARITKHTGPSQILISSSVHRALQNDPNLICQSLGEMNFKGKEEKEEIFEVVWTDPVTYANLRRNSTVALARGELLSPGLKVEDLIQKPEDLPSARVPQTQAHHVPPALASRYDILRVIGEGGMGVVYEARDRITDTIVALKVIRPELSAREDLIERFKAELLSARKVTHKNVCRVHEISRFEDVFAISMEYVEGDTLREILSRYGPLSVRRARDWTQQICSALQAAHEAGVIHRDLKPENIVVTKANVLKIMDFGLAHSIETKATQTGTFLGTPAYAAPEQIRGEKTDVRADIYALGAILYEMLTGSGVFQAESATAILMRHLHDPPVPPRSMEPSIPSHLEGVILRCLQKKPEKRYASISEFEAALVERPTQEPKAFSGTHSVDHELLRWRGLDWVLVAAGLLGVFFFVRYSVYVVPEANSRIHILGAVAEREAQRLVRMAGWAETNVLESKRPNLPYIKGLPGPLDMQLSPALSHSSKNSRIELSELIAKSIPMVWLVKLKTIDTGLLFEVTVDSEGRPVRMKPGDLNNDFLTKTPGSVAAVSAQAQMSFATEYLKEFFGADPATLSPAITTSTQSRPDPWWSGGGDLVAVQRYSWSDAKPDADGWRQTYALDLVGPRLFSASRTFKGTEAPPDFAKAVYGDFYIIFALLVLLALMAPTFFAARLYGMLFQRRLLLVIWLPLFAFAYSLGASSTDKVPNQISWGIEAAVLAGFVAGLLSYLWLSSEHLMLNRWPEKWSSTTDLLSLKVAASSGVPLAIIRGVALGTAATGIYALLRLVGFRYRLAPWLPYSIDIYDYVTTFSPALDAIMSAGLHALATALTLAFFISLVRRYSLNSLLLVGVGSSTWLFTGLYVTTSDAIPRLLFEWLVVFVFASIVCFALVHYDFLTQFVCLFTAYLGMDSYAWWNLFRDVGNFQYTAIFLWGGAIVLLSIFLAFRERFVGAKARLAKIYE